MIKLTLITIILLFVPTVSAIQFNYSQEDDNTDNFENIPDNSPQIKPKVNVEVEGTANDDKIKGDTGNDKIEGNQGNDQIEGGEGNDSLKGGKENDEIEGDKGNDKLEGGEGIDEMKGGEGADSFICDSLDKVIDFNSQEGDTISGQCTFEDKSSPNNQENILP